MRKESVTHTAARFTCAVGPESSSPCMVTAFCGWSLVLHAVITPSFKWGGGEGGEEGKTEEREGGKGKWKDILKRNDE